MQTQHILYKEPSPTAQTHVAFEENVQIHYLL